MGKNLDSSGRVLRGAIAFILLFLAWWASSWLLFAASLFTFYEALAGWCAFYALIGKNSCPIDKRKK